MNRRDLLKLSGTALAGPLAAQTTGARQKVIVIGGGIAGLSCAFELMKRGHDVTVLEASGRAGGHVKTLHDPFADGLYADLGAEHFTIPVTPSIGDISRNSILHPFPITGATT
jgi:monoamine oxidase